MFNVGTVDGSPGCRAAEDIFYATAQKKVVDAPFVDDVTAQEPKQSDK